MARVVAPGGVVTIVDFVSHDREWMRDELGVTWLGFDTGEVASWFADAGLAHPDLELQQSASAARNLPTTFIASAHKPARAT
jgi:hypothetical protein